jgi:hypothetical protein
MSHILQRKRIIGDYLECIMAQPVYTSVIFGSHVSFGTAFALVLLPVSVANNLTGGNRLS